MTQIKIIDATNMQTLENSVNAFLHGQREIISSVIDIKFEMKERSGGLPGAVTIFAYIIYSVK
jgi:hypothetical protein